MTMDPQTEDRVINAVLAVCNTADKLRECKDTDAMKAVLSRIWFDVHDATDIINQAEAATRAEAISRTIARAFA